MTLSSALSAAHRTIGPAIWNMGLALTTTATLRVLQSAGSGGKSRKSGKRTLLAKGVGNVIVTLGSEGALIRTPAEELLIPARTVTPVDTTAAGDVFNGALLVALSEGRSLADAVRFAAHSASVSVTRMGAQASIPWRGELETLA